LSAIEGYSTVKGWTKEDLARLTWINWDKIPVLSVDVCASERMLNTWIEKREGQGVVMDRKIPEEIVSIRTIQEVIDEITPFVVGGLISLIVERCLYTVHSKMQRERERGFVFLKKS